MLLSADMFEAVIKGLKTDKSASDKRTSLRVGIRGRITVIPATEQGCLKPLQVWCKDISSSGIAFLQPEPALNVGDKFVLELPNAKGEPLRLMCSVVRRQKVEGTVILGSRFVREVSEPLVFIAPKAAPIKPPAPKPATRTPPLKSAAPAPTPAALPIETKSEPAKPDPKLEEINRIRDAMMK